MSVSHDVIFYDADCRVCSGLARRVEPIFRKRGFALAPLQSALARKRLHLEPASLLAEMRIATRDGGTLGGADALIYLSRFVWWGWPLHVLARLPGARPLMRKWYDWFAARRHCIGGQCATAGRPGWPGRAPLPAFTAVAAIVTRGAPGWLRMWALAAAVFAGCKWLTWWDCPKRAGWKRSLAYLFLWPGMDADAFLDRERCVPPPDRSEWLAAFIKTGAGAALIWFFARQAAKISPLTAGWTGMAGLILFLHFGTFHLLALTWRSLGIDAAPIMERPAAARSLAEFWGRRWNRGFNDLAHRHLFVPTRSRLGATGAIVATLVTFLASGLVHDLVISIPARGGYGLPTLYFMIQGLGVVFERGRAGRRLGLRRGVRGRAFALAVAGAPLFWLFHPPFVHRVIVPFLEVIKAL